MSRWAVLLLLLWLWCPVPVMGAGSEEHEHLPVQRYMLDEYFASPWHDETAPRRIARDAAVVLGVSAVLFWLVRRRWP